jgi:hypothetical protein
LDGRHLGVATGAEPDRAPTCAAGDAVAGQVNVELSGENRGGVVDEDDGAVQELFRALQDEVAACSQGEPVARTRPPAAATAIVAPVLEN